MKPTRANPLFSNFFRRNSLVAAVVVSLAGAAGMQSAQAATLYWDTNGNTPGSGDAGGTWDQDAFWSTDAFGAAATSNWVDGSNAVFSADTDGTGAWTVTVNGTVSTPSIVVEEAGAKTIAGGTITIGGGTISTVGAGNGSLFTISSKLAGSGGLTLAASGDLSDTGGAVGGALLLSGENTFTGKVTITGGLVRTASNFGSASNTILLNGGGLVDANNSSTIANNIEIGAAGGTVRLYGSATTNLNGSISNAAGVVNGNLKHTDGGTLRLGGSGAGFSGTFNNARGALQITAANANWSNTTFALNGSGGVLTFSGTGTATAKAIITTTKDTIVNNGTVLDVPTYTWSTTSGGSWLKSEAGVEGTVTSSTGTFTITTGSLASGPLETDNNQVNISITNSGATPVAVVKNNNNQLALNRVNTFSGGLTINAGRIQTNVAGALGTGTVIVKNDAQAYLMGVAPFANNFVLNGVGTQDNVGTLGALRLENATVNGNVNIATPSRITAHDNSTGTLAGTLTGSAALEINSTFTANNGVLNFTGNTSGFTGGMTVTQGTLNVGALGGAVTVNGGTANVSGAIAGAATINSGTLSLANGGKASAPTINGGTLTLQPGSTVTGNIVTSGISTVNVGGTVTGKVTLEPGDTFGSNGGTIAGGLDLTDANVNFVSPVTVNSNVKVTGTQMITLLSLPVPGTPLTLLNYTGSYTGGIGGLVLANAASYRGVTFANPAGKLTVSVGGQSSMWVGNDATNPTFWDTASLNWSSTDRKFFNGDSVTFDDTAATSTVVLQNVLSPSAVTFNNSTLAYTLSGGGLAGSTGITKNGSNTLDLGGVSTFTGAVAVNSGVLKLTSTSALGRTSGVTIASGARANLNGQASGTVATGRYSWTIAGDGGDGPGGLGAIFNTAGSISGNSGVLHLTLAGNAEIGGSTGRFDVGLYGGSIQGGGFTLTKVGANHNVMRAPAANITYVVNAGTLSFEDFDNASGSNPITVNNAGTILGGYGNRTLANAVTLNEGTILTNLGGGTSVWSGDITIAAGGANLGGANNQPLVLTGHLLGSGRITKDAGNLYLENANNSGFTGKWFLDQNATFAVNDLSFGAVPAVPVADYFVADNVRITSGDRSGPGNLVIHANRGFTLTDVLWFNPGIGGSITVNGAITGTAPIIAGTANLRKDNNSGALTFNNTIDINGKIMMDGGTATFTKSVATTGGADLASGIVTSFSGPVLNLGSTNYGIHAGAGTTNINVGTGTLGDLELGNASGVSHTVNHTGGALAVLTDFKIGHYGNETSFYNISGGSVTMPESPSATGESDPNVILGIDGTGVLTISGTGVINTSSLVVNGRNEGHNTGGVNAGPDTLNLTGGRLNIGKWGMRTQGTTYAVNLGGGTLGAYADWTSGLAMTLAGTTTVNTLDSVDTVTPRTITLGGVLSGTGGITKTNAGSLVLSGTNTYTGNTVIDGGKVFTSSSESEFKVNTGGTIQPGTPVAAGLARLNNGLTLNGGTAYFRARYGDGDVIQVTSEDGFKVAKASTIAIEPAGDMQTGDLIPLIDYNGAPLSAADFGKLSLAPLSNPHLSVALRHDTLNTSISLEVNAVDSIIWKGQVNGLWNVDTTANWVLESSPATASKFYENDTVTLDDTGIARPNITLVGEIKVSGEMEVANSTGAYVLSGSGIGGNAKLTKQLEGSLVLLNDNTYTGATTINGGTVAVGNGGTTGALGGTGPIELNNATLTISRSDNQTLSRTITGGGGTFIKGGTNTLTMNAGNNTADIVVNAGTLAANGGSWATSFAAGRTITINNGAKITTVTHSLGGFGGATLPAALILNEDSSWTLTGEQQLFGTVSMTAALIDGTNEIRGGGDIKVLAHATKSSTIASRINLSGAINFEVADGGAATDLAITGNVIGSSTLRKTGAGKLVLTGDNTYTGGTAVNGGIVEAASIADAGGVGSIGTGYLGIAEDGTFRYTGAGGETSGRALWMDTGIQTKTIEVTNAVGNITFSGVAGRINKPFRKSGPGSLTIADEIEEGATVTVDGGRLTLNGVNTYSGSSTVNSGGTLVINGTSIADTAGLVINGSGVVEVTEGGTEVVEVVDTLTIGGVQVNAGTYGAVGSGATNTSYPNFAGAGVVQVTSGPTAGGGYGTWAAINAPTGTPAGDYDGDGVSNAVEFVLGGSATTNDSNKLPKASIDGGNLVFTFVRNHQSKGAGTDVAIEMGTTLATWTSTYNVGDTTATSDTGVQVVDNGDGTDTITLTVTRAPDAKKFARLKVTIGTP